MDATTPQPAKRPKRRLPVKDYLIQRAVRLPISIIADLDTLSGARKVSGREPATQQAILAKALREYFDKQPDL